MRYKMSHCAAKKELARNTSQEAESCSYCIRYIQQITRVSIGSGRGVRAYVLTRKRMALAESEFDGRKEKRVTSDE